jgi:rhamnulokinase
MAERSRVFNRCHVAFDCGNSSIRVVAGIYDGASIHTHLVHQVPNETIAVNGLEYWDILNIFKELQKGLKKAYLEFGAIDSVGIATWGIDFGILGKSGQLLGNPLSYRNGLGLEMLSRLSDEQKDGLFQDTGIPEHPMNTLYQILGVREYLPELFENAASILLIPELLTWLFTGTMRGESSIDSTTQMMDMRDKRWSAKVMDRFGIYGKLFQETLPHGASCGMLRREIADELRIPPCEFLCVPSHDTASAVLSVPSAEEHFLFISAGTWSLIGSELRKPIIDDRVRRFGFANEGGALDTITFLKNSAGMHILQNIKNEIEEEIGTVAWDDLVIMAEKYEGEVPVFDPNDQVFYNPPKMMDAINGYVGRKGNRTGALPAMELVASAYTSLACSYRKAIEDIEEVTGRKHDKVHIIGGGCRNEYLNRMTAELTCKEVVAGPDEATSIGNIGMQIMGRDPSLNLQSIRRIIGASQPIKIFREDDGGRAACRDKGVYDEYLRLVGRH